ncbi:probable F-box protein At3g25550 [Rutidosis leptorrhynchoides]|uniref:probable F-box protein At3g25550 n=1 Tax=Rutidosis leptorrhynchoides TaxID=125765 RepID=UPI003A991E24
MNDVLEEILARLDVKDVVRCKSVCKSWYDLISSTYFVKSHLKHSYIKKHEHGYLRVAFRGGFSLVGSCDGLVCISSNDDDQLLLTNPSTREVRKLPMPRIKYRGK